MLLFSEKLSTRPPGRAGKEGDGCSGLELASEVKILGEPPGETLEPEWTEEGRQGNGLV